MKCEYPFIRIEMVNGYYSVILYLSEDMHSPISMTFLDYELSRKLAESHGALLGVRVLEGYYRDF